MNSELVETKSEKQSPPVDLPSLKKKKDKPEAGNITSQLKKSELLQKERPSLGQVIDLFDQLTDADKGRLIAVLLAPGWTGVTKRDRKSDSRGQDNPRPKPQKQGPMKDRSGVRTLKRKIQRLRVKLREAGDGGIRLTIQGKIDDADQRLRKYLADNPVVKPVGQQPILLEERVDTESKAVQTDIQEEAQ